jgi:hypothetical protein
MNCSYNLADGITEARLRKGGSRAFSSTPGVAVDKSTWMKAHGAVVERAAGDAV